MAAILAVLLVGVTHLAQVLKLVPGSNGGETILSMVGRAVYGSGSFLHFALQISTMAILFMGANTSFADFPRLSSILARDGLMPRQFMNRGDRLAFSNGIIGLAVLAMAKTSVVMFFSQVNLATARALALSSSLAADQVLAVTITRDEASLARARADWRQLGVTVPLVDHRVMVVIPEFVPERWWQNLLHNRNALRLKAALLGLPWVAVMDVPVHFDPAQQQVAAPAPA